MRDYDILGADGQTYPADDETARAWVKEGRITRTTQVYDAAVGEWRQAGEIEALFPRLPPVTAEHLESKRQGCKVALLLALASLLVGMFATAEPACGVIAGALLLAAFIVLLVWFLKNYT